MSSFIQGQFALVQRPHYVFSDSESENEEVIAVKEKEKKQKKTIDIEGIKKELIGRPNYEVDNLRRRNSKLSTRTLMLNPIIPTPPILIEQLAHLNWIKRIKEEVPPELLNAFYSELRYHYVPAMTPVYRQGDQNKRYYIILDGLCAVMKPRERMVGNQILDIVHTGTIKKSENDPYGLKSAFPDYLVLKMLRNGDPFGEGSIKLEIARSSTVLAVENTHLIYLPENSYMTVLDPHLSKALDAKLEYFAKTIFKNVDPSEYMGVMIEAKLITFKANDILYDEGDKSGHFYFIINGQVEISKQVKKKSLLLTSYGEFQQFGDVEIMQKITRFTKAKVISPRMSVYRIRKSTFFDNLGNYNVYVQLNKNSDTIYSHWKIIYQEAMRSANPTDDVFQAAQDVQNNKPNHLAKHIVNKKIQENQKLSQIKVFQHLMENNVKDVHQINSSPGRNILQRVYSNTLQKYQARLLKKPQCVSTQEDMTLRGITEYHIDTSRYANNDNNISQTAHLRLPSLNSISIPKVNVSPQVKLDDILDSISRLPKVHKDNIVLSLMYQQAYKAENPEKKAKQIQQVISASFRNVQRQFQPKEEIKHVGRSNSNVVLLSHLKIADMMDSKRQQDDYINFVHSKRIN